MEAVKLIAFSAIMLYASVVDYKRQIVQKRTYLLLFLTGMINPTALSVASMILIFIPMFLTVMFVGGMGGGDIKIMAMCGFVLGLNALFGIAVGLILGIIVPTVCRFFTRQHSHIKKPIPLVPFLAVGTIATGIFFL